MVKYTRHVCDKFKTKEAKLLKIGKKTIEYVAKTGSVVEVEEDVVTMVGSLDKRHSLCVVFKYEGKDIKIITFFAAKKGRYERKILH